MSEVRAETVEEIRRLWRDCKTVTQKQTLLTGPQRGWFIYCRALVQQRPLSAELPSADHLLQFFPQTLRPIAEAHLACARLAAAGQWSSDTVESAQCAELHRNLFPPGSAPHQPIAFLRDLAEGMLGRPPGPQTPETRVVVVPLVSGSGSQANGNLVQLVLERLDVGQGEVFLDTRQAFLNLDDSFRSIFRDAPRAVTSFLGCAPNGDVRVRIEHFHADRHSLWQSPLTGNSAGGALALGLWALWSGGQLERGVVPSFALAPAGGEPDGRCHPIGGAVAKAREIAETIGRSGTFLVAAAQATGLQSRADHLGLRVESAATLQQAVTIASGRLGQLLAYLDAVTADANKVPDYLRGSRLEAVRVRVRVHSERQWHDSKLAEERERARRQGWADPEAAERIYLHRLSPDGGVSEEGADNGEKSRIEILDWDKDVRGKVRHGVVVGDPGLGKTWLLKWEAARHADEARQHLRQSGDLAAVTIPLRCRLTNVAASLPGVKPEEALPMAILNAVSHCSEPLRSFFAERLTSDKIFLLLDAYDEVPVELRKRLHEALESWVPGSKARVLFTSRVVGYERPWSMPEKSETDREMELLPFDDSQTGEFVDKFFAAEPEAGGELRGLLRQAPQARGMAQIPLLLGFLCALHREERRKTTAERRDLSRMRRTDLYADMLRRPPRPGDLGRKAASTRSMEEGDGRDLDLLEGIAILS